MDIYDSNKYNVSMNGDRNSWLPLIRQIFICIPVVLFYYIQGLFVGAPTVFIPQLRKESNSTDAVSIDMESWLSSAMLFSAVPWSLVISVISYRFGRKTVVIILCIFVLISNLMFYFSTSLQQIIISQIIFGILPAAHMTISIMILTEYFSPKYRGLFMTLKSATTYWGIWTANALGTYFHWKNIVILSFFCGVYNALSITFWPESPYWLATKGRFEECASVHRWLKGTDQDSERELRCLIESQKEYLKKKLNKDTIHTHNYIKNIILMLKFKKFYKPLTFCALAICLYHLSGKMACSVYAIDIIKKITSSESMAYEGMLILDGFTVLGMYVGAVLSKFVKRRTILLVSSSIGTAFMFTLSIYLYLIKLCVIKENRYFSMFLLAFYSLSISCGPIIMSLCITGELTPLKNRSSFLCILSFFFNVLMGGVIKVAPYLFQTVGLEGSFLFYGICSVILISLLYIYLPETKDKTILEIEQYFEDTAVPMEEKEFMIFKPS